LNIYFNALKLFKRDVLARNFQWEKVPVKFHGPEQFEAPAPEVVRVIKVLTDGNLFN